MREGERRATGSRRWERKAMEKRGGQNRCIRTAAETYPTDNTHSTNTHSTNQPRHSSRWGRTEGYLLARQVSDVDKGVVEGGEDVAHSEDILPLSHLWSQADHLLLLLLLTLTRCHCCRADVRASQNLLEYPYRGVHAGPTVSSGTFWIFSTT